MLGELDSTEHAAQLRLTSSISADCREASRRDPVDDPMASPEQLQRKVERHHQVEQAGINNHHATGEIVAKLDAAATARIRTGPRFGRARSRRRCSRLVGLAVLPFVRVNVQPRFQWSTYSSSRVENEQSRTRRIVTLLDSGMRRLGGTAPLALESPHRRWRIRAAGDRGERPEFWTQPGSGVRPASEPANLTFSSGCSGCCPGEVSSGVAEGLTGTCSTGRPAGNSRAGGSRQRRGGTTVCYGDRSTTVWRGGAEASSGRIGRSGWLPCARRAAGWNRETHGGSRS